MGLMDRVEKNQSLYSFIQAMKPRLVQQLHLELPPAYNLELGFC